MTKKISELSIFFPFWDEEANVVQVVEDAIKVAKKIAVKWEIIMVNDGSTDGTLQSMRNLAKKHEHVRYISHEINRGYGAALRSGFEKARYEFVVFTDGDGQFNFSEIDKFY